LPIVKLCRPAEAQTYPKKFWFNCSGMGLNIRLMTGIHGSFVWLPSVLEHSSFQTSLCIQTTCGKFHLFICFINTGDQTQSLTTWATPPALLGVYMCWIFSR
jgi:hypothetical protein